jgi:inosose dehydratase
VDFGDEASFDKIIDIYRQNGLAIPSIGVQYLCGDVPSETRYFEFARKAGAKVISVLFGVDSVPGSYRTAEKLAEKYDVTLAIHNHGGRHWLGSIEMLRHVFAHTSERIGLCLDTAWALDSGEDPLAMAEVFSARLYSLHIKDFIFDRARQPVDVVVGQGNLQLGKLLALLRQIHFDGPAILEYEGDVDNPMPAIQACVAAVLKEA